MSILCNVRVNLPGSPLPPLLRHFLFGCGRAALQYSLACYPQSFLKLRKFSGTD
jgi:hypothetical protein